MSAFSIARDILDLATVASISALAAVLLLAAPVSARPAQQPEPREQTETKASGDTEQSAESSPPAKRKYEYKKFTNVYYRKTDDYSLLCDIYQPTAEGTYPAVLAIHGGAWRHGSKLQMLRHAWKLAGAGYVVVAINYRHAPEYKFPAQVHDAKAAVRWMKLKHEKLKIDPEKIAVFGYSAGGHLAAMLGTSDQDDDLEGDVPESMQQFSSRVQCVVAGGAPCEFSWIKSNALKSWLGDNQANDPEVYQKAAPTTYVSADDPPFIFFHGDSDKVVPMDSSKKLHDSLLAAGIDSTYHSVENSGHFATFSNTTWLDDAIKFLDEKLERSVDE